MRSNPDQLFELFSRAGEAKLDLSLGRNANRHRHNIFSRTMHRRPNINEINFAGPTYSNQIEGEE